MSKIVCSTFQEQNWAIGLPLVNNMSKSINNIWMLKYTKLVSHGKCYWNSILHMHYKIFEAYFLSMLYFTKERHMSKNITVYSFSRAVNFHVFSENREIYLIKIYIYISTDVPLHTSNWKHNMCNHSLLPHHKNRYVCSIGQIAYPFQTHPLSSTKSSYIMEKRVSNFCMWFQNDWVKSFQLL